MRSTFDNIGAGLAENNQQNGAFAVQISAARTFATDVDDVGDIGEMDSCAVVVATITGL